MGTAAESLGQATSFVSPVGVGHVSVQIDLPLMLSSFGLRVSRVNLW